MLTSFGRTMRITQTIAKRLPTAPPVIELDASNAEDFDAARRPGPRARRRPRRGAALDRLRPGGGAGRQLPQDRVGRRRDGACRSRRTRLKALAVAAAAADAERRLRRGADLRRDRGLAEVRLDGRGEGCVRVDVALPGPRPRAGGDPGQPGRRRPAASQHGGQVDPRLRGVRRTSGPSRAPLDWDVNDFEPAARACVALLSDWFPRTTGEIVHVDGGVHAMGA